jgi:hypothetical protein
MKTDDLIDLLSHDARSTMDNRDVLTPALLVTAACSAGLLVVVLGLRVDWYGLQAWSGLALKLLLAAVVMYMALQRLRMASRPEVTLAGSLRPFLVPAAVAFLLAIGSLAMTPPELRGATIVGDSLLECLTTITMLSLPILGGMLWVLRKGAVSDGFRGGLLAGLLSGASAVMIFSMHCVEDDPAFYGIWYSVGVLLVMLIGGLLGRRLLRW